MTIEKAKTEMLIEKARHAAGNAYAPYSKFIVGAALLCADGEVFEGCNIENASYGLTICAEQSAICAAVSQGRRDFIAIAVLSPSEDDIITPCGNCRQVLAEFNDDIQVICANQKGDYKILPLSELLPFSFQLPSNPKARANNP
ncbi:cytidine deaminase [Candidatus Sumerlaeota bacterium]|nr:cytidine deaminase [Candidatus Sumerlaeota bacterium]